MEPNKRIDEYAALDVICAVEDVQHHQWLPEGHARRADLEVTIGGRVVTVEITMSTSAESKALWNVAWKMRSPERSDSWPQRVSELSHKWTVNVSDHDYEHSNSGRRLKELVKALIRVLAEAETTAATPEVMRQHAVAMLDPNPYDPNMPGPTPSWLADGWAEAEASGVDFDEQMEAHSIQHCGYWYPSDIVDCVTKDMWRFAF